jgi:hypothetical protein
LVFDCGDSSLTKKLVGVTVHHDPLPSGGQVIVKYEVDPIPSTYAWTTALTNTTANSLSAPAVNVAGSGELPTFKEIHFRIESTGGAIVTGLSFEYNIFLDKPY